MLLAMPRQAAIAAAVFIVASVSTVTPVESFLQPRPAAATKTTNAILLSNFQRRPSSFLQSTAIPPMPKTNQKAVDINNGLDPNEAVKSLEKLLRRQRDDMRMTEKLLESLKNETRSQAVEYDSPMSYAKSFMSGFDYGFVSRSEGATTRDIDGNAVTGKYGPPANIHSLGAEQFKRNLEAILGEYKDEQDVAISPEQLQMRNLLKSLTLNSTEIWERETAHGPIYTPWIIKLPYLLVCWLLDFVFEKQYVPSRFFLLETVARMPYFSYISLLHLYETIGFWRRSADIKRIHFAEELNEYRHLLIMEGLGGDQSWWVRFVAQHSAIVYYFVLCLLWAISPSLSYKFSELLETHAVNTYGTFLDENEELLKILPPPLAAVEYYSLGSSDPFYAEFQTSSMRNGKDIRRPGEQMTSLYDVFTAIKEDERDHVSTMQECLDPDVALQSPSIERRVLIGIGLAAAASLALTNYGMLNSADLDAAMDAVDTAAGAATENSIGSIVIDAAIGVGAALGRDWVSVGETDEAAELSPASVETRSAVQLVLASARANLNEVMTVIGRLLATIL